MSSPALRHAARLRGGFTVLEAAIAGAITVVFLTSLFALNSTVMRLLGSAAETANASQHLQQRVEQVRLANWTQITDPAWLQDNLLKFKTDAAINLPGMKETITVTPYVSPSSSSSGAGKLTPFTVTRDPKGQVTVAPGSPASLMATQEMVQVDLTIQWPGWSRTRNRALTTLVSRWGISK